MGEEHLIEVFHVQAGIVTLIYDLQAATRVPGKHGLGEGKEKAPVGKAQQFLDVAVLDVEAGIGDDLVEDALAVPETPIGGTGDSGKARVADMDTFSLRDFREVFHGLPQ